jgi:hypothetical protein
VRVAQHTVAVILSEEGRAVLQLAAVNVPESAAILVHVQDTDDLGLWVRTPREDGEHLLLVRWEYVLTVDFPIGETKTMGLKI